MSSFFEKIKKGMGLELTAVEKEEKKPNSKLKKIKEESAEIKEEKQQEVNPPTGGEKKEEKEVKKEKLVQGFSLKNLNKEEGELAVDVYQTEGELIIRSAIAGVRPEKLDILVEDDVITISGIREEPEEKEKIDYFSRECYFGPFSRKMISPVEIDSSRAKAIMKEGILLIRIPKIQKVKKIKLEVEKE